MAFETKANRHSTDVGNVNNNQNARGRENLTYAAIPKIAIGNKTRPQLLSRHTTRIRIGRIVSSRIRDRVDRRRQYDRSRNPINKTT